MILVIAGVIYHAEAVTARLKMPSSAGTGEFSLAVFGRTVCSTEKDSPVSMDDKDTRGSRFFLPGEWSNWKTVKLSVNCGRSQA
ncbi:MAG: hypothetical protein CMJ81_02645 [Planctomycetaceae bacterium]|nr:hypothetical protein [Planctomycetaceae bacterium]MBP62107.1 hypothetical protein [Planctomycetaceae bacterium]